MVASLDGFIARSDGRVDWLDTRDEFPEGRSMDPEFVSAFLDSIDCYVMGSRTYEAALAFESSGAGWAYGDKATFVLTSRQLPRSRESVHFHSGDVRSLLTDRLRPTYRSIWCVGGSETAGELLRADVVDEICYTIAPILLGDGLPFFKQVSSDIPLHLADVKAYQSGLVEMRYEIRRDDSAPPPSP